MTSTNKVQESKSEKITPVQSAAPPTETIIEEDIDDSIDDKWAQHTDEFCRKEKVPTVQSCYESPRASANRGWQTCRNPPSAARSRVPVSSKPTVRPRVRQESTPRRVIPAKLSAVPGNISPKKKPSPRVKKTSPYAERF